MATTNIKPKQVSKRILSVLQDRAHDVVVSRFGLTPDAERKTLEAIGKKYGITRERVRQIENAALTTIRKSDVYGAEKEAFAELKQALLALGSVVAEDELLAALAKDDELKNHFHFYLVLGDEFKKHAEDEEFHARWTIDEAVSNEVHGALKKLYTNLSTDELVPESEIISRFLEELKNINEEFCNEEIARRWLGMSKSIKSNPLNEWGVAESPNVKTRGIKDYAYLIMRKHGNPMHFREVAKAIETTFGKKTHIATTHNELIKDARFVLVGRGTYGLAEWGYKPGVVKEVIKEILKKNGPMSKEDIVDKVLKERFLKKNTILVNLQNVKYFKKNKQGLYTLA
jgi:hypothetical protein